MIHLVLSKGTKEEDKETTRVVIDVIKNVEEMVTGHLHPILRDSRIEVDTSPIIRIRRLMKMINLSMYPTRRNQDIKDSNHNQRVLLILDTRVVIEAVVEVVEISMTDLSQALMPTEEATIEVVEVVMIEAVVVATEEVEAEVVVVVVEVMHQLIERQQTNMQSRSNRINSGLLLTIS